MTDRVYTILYVASVLSNSELDDSSIESIMQWSRFTIAIAHKWQLLTVFKTDHRFGPNQTDGNAPKPKGQVVPEFQRLKLGVRTKKTPRQ